MDSTQSTGTPDANPPVSTDAVQPNSFDPAKFAADLEARILKRLEDPRLIQSQKDKVIDAVKKDKSMREIFAELREMETRGMSPEQIELELWKRDVESKLNNPAPVTQSPGKAVVPAHNETLKLILPQLNLDANDPEVSALLANDAPLEERLATLSSISNRKKSAIPNPALVAQSAGDSTASKTLQDEYQARASKTRGMALVELKMEYRKKGLDIN